MTDKYFQSLAEIRQDPTEAEALLKMYLPRSMFHGIPWILDSMEVLLGDPTFNAADLCFFALDQYENIEPEEDEGFDTARIKVLHETDNWSNDQWKHAIVSAQEAGDNLRLAALYIAHEFHDVTFIGSSGY